MGPTLLQTYCLNGARIDASPAINAGIRVNDGLAARHADRIAGTLIDAGLTSGAFCLVYFSRHPATLSN
jgi:hypothetical protein